MRVSPRTKVSTFKKRFEEEFGVNIKCHKGMSKGHIADDNDELHEICTRMEVDRDFKLKISGNMKVSTVEREVAGSLGFLIQVLNPDGSNAKNSRTLSDIRRDYSGGSKKSSSPTKPPRVSVKDQTSEKKGCLSAIAIVPFLWLLFS
jgi:hypothetical protein